MTDTPKIAPALTPEQWKAAQENEFVKQDMARRFASGRQGTTHGLIALLNDMLRDDDPRKITRADVDDERQAYHDAVMLARHFQDAGMEPARLACRERAARHRRRAEVLASYLPP